MIPIALSMPPIQPPTKAANCHRFAEVFPVKSAMKARMMSRTKMRARVMKTSLKCFENRARRAKLPLPIRIGPGESCPPLLGSRRLPREPEGICPEREPFLCAGQRSEEHTSELQSRFDLVCRLLLEKK